MVGFVTVPSIAWGSGAIEQLSGLGARRAVVVVDPALAGAIGPRRVVEELERGGATVDVVDDLRTLDRLETVVRLAERLRALGPDRLVAVGGGTTIDGVKAARLAYERPDLDLADPPVELRLPEPPRSRLAAIPTTSGSGAEASWIADLVGPDDAPRELADRALLPEWALVDPWFAASLPAAGVLAGAFEAAALACEAYLSAWSNPFSDALAVAALRTVVRRLPHAVRWSDDPEARGALHYAATEAGIAASNAQRGVAHALARALVRPTGLAYATVLGLVLPPVLDFDRPAARERLDALAALLADPEESGVPSVADRLRRLAAQVGAPTGLEAAGVRSGALDGERPRIIAETLRSPAVLANPRVPNAAEIEALLDTLEGRGRNTGAPPRA